MSKNPITYKDAGVDIHKAEASLERMKQQINRTHTPEVLRGVGLFGGFYDISGHGLKHPVLVSSTDGVGTKLRVAMLSGKHDTVGQDLVNHCINDIAVSGAKPLYFLDYFASGTLEPGVYEAVLGGVASGCEKAGVPLIGGETAEMPDFYGTGDYDLCGTIVGIVDKDLIIDGSSILPGDILVGVHGNGLHTNGYTLARKVLLNEYDVTTYVEELGMSVGDALLRIHPNYFELISTITAQLTVKGISHVTGGGIVKNTRRILPAGLSLDVNWDAWTVPSIFQIIQRLGNVPAEDMREAFNMGIGLVFIMDSAQRNSLFDLEEQTGATFVEIGRVAKMA